MIKFLERDRKNKYFLIIIIGLILLIIASLIILILSFSGDEPTKSDITPKSKEHWKIYDCYYFSIFWPPSSCYDKDTEKEKCFDEIKKLNDEIYFTIHGLWPSFKSGEIPEKCNQKTDIAISFDDQEFNQIISEKWPGLYSNNEKFWSHEYNKHGYCYIQRIGKDPEKDYRIYFEKTLSIFENYKNLMEEILPDTTKGLHNISKTKFKDMLKYSSLKLQPLQYRLICHKNEIDNSNVLEEIRFIYDLDFKIINNTNTNDECPDIFQIYFSKEDKIPTYKKYNNYIFSLFWNPSICKLKGKQCYKILKSKELNIFRIHGLLPSFSDKKYLQWCNLDKDIEIIPSKTELYEKMENYWLSTYGTNENFWKHEYNKHGLCYNQRYDKPIENYDFYFEKTINLYSDLNIANFFKEIPGILGGENILNRTYVSNNLVKKFGYGTFALSCINYNGKYYLYEIKLKLDMDFQPTKIGTTEDNCPEIFHAEFLEVEGPKKQHIGFYDTYDMYYFTILWQATSCRSKGEQCYERIKNVPRNVLSIHGLWPNYRNGTLPDWCNGKNDIEIEINDTKLINFMNNYYSGGYHSNEYFWGHEYNKHGYCYNQRNNIDINNYEAYFQKIKELYLKYNFSDVFINLYKGKIVPGDMEIDRNLVENYFDKKGIPNDAYVIVCTNKTKDDRIEPHLLEIRVRFDLDFNLLRNKSSTSEFDCPEKFYAEFL